MLADVSEVKARRQVSYLLRLRGARCVLAAEAIRKYIMIAPAALATNQDVVASDGRSSRRPYRLAIVRSITSVLP